MLRSEPDSSGSTFYFGWSELQKSDSIQIESELPLFLEISDPDHFLVVHESRIDGKTRIEATLARPIQMNPVDETTPFFNPNVLPRITVSSTKNWGDIARAVSPNYEKVLAAPLPKVLNDILLQAETKESPVDKINAVTSERADNLSSNPDWVSITRPTFEADGQHFFLGYVEVDGTAAKSAALNMSDEKAMSEPMRSLVDFFLDQNQVGEDLSSSIGQRIISSTRSFRPPMPGLHIVKRYWELVETSNSATGESRTSLRVYSLAGLPIAELARAKQIYLSNLSRNTEVKKLLDEVGAKQRERALASGKKD